MTDTLSPTLDTQMLSHQYQQSAYQRILLAEMGITPWVGQSEIGQIFSPETLFATLAETVENHNENSLSNLSGISLAFSEPTNFSQNSSCNVSTQNPTTQSPVLPTPTLTPNNPPISHVQYPQPVTPQINQNLVQNQPAIRCHYYAIKVQNWVIVADGDFLNHHSPSLQLWHNISHALSARQYEFRFPFTEGQHERGENSTLLVQASFAGFLCAIERGSYLDNGEGMTITKSLISTSPSSPKIGIVTPVAEWLENEAIRRLPYLTEMLEDYRQKRQFWQLMIANEA